jgi:hypothetical protein
MSISVVARPVQTVPSVDVDKYGSNWYEITSFEISFKEECQYTTEGKTNVMEIARNLSSLICGERGIRTPGPVTVNSFQDCRVNAAFQPFQIGFYSICDLHFICCCLKVDLRRRLVKNRFKGKKCFVCLNKRRLLGQMGNEFTQK